MTSFRRSVLLVPVLLSGLLLASCGGGGDVDNEASFRVLHASPDSPPVNILVDGVTLRSGVDYQNGTDFIFVTPRAYQFGIQALRPGDDATVVDESVPLDADSEYTVLAIGKAASDSVEALVIRNPFEEVPAGNVRVQVVHAAPDVPAVDIYLTSEGASLPGSTPLDQLAYGEYAVDRRLIPPGPYVLRVTPAGDPDSVLFDSGPLGTLGSRADLLITLVQNTTAGPSPLSVVIYSQFGHFTRLDTNTPSQLRVVNLSPDSPSLDVVGTPLSTSFPDVPFSSAGNLSGITLDEANGRALVVDNRLAAIVAVDLLSGARSVLSDNSTPGSANPFRGPAAIAVDPVGNRALVTDKTQGAVVAVDLESGARTTLSGKLVPDSLNPFFAPLGIAVDTAGGRALVVDNGVTLMGVDLVTGARAVVSNNLIPDSVNPFGAPIGIALDSAGGRALIADNGRDNIFSVNLLTGARTVLSSNTTPATTNPFGAPVGIALDSANNRALVVDNRLGATLAVNLQTGARTVLSNATTPDAVNRFSSPAGIAVDSANGRALVIDNRLGAVVAVDLQTGARSILSASSTQNGIPFLGNTGYVNVAPDQYVVRGEKTAEPNPSTVLFSSSPNLVAPGSRTTLFVNNLLANIVGQASVDNSRPVFTEGKLRFIHAGPAAGTVDLYVQLTGTPIADKEPTFQNLVASTLTSHLAFAPGNYTITFTKADDKNVVVAVQDVAALGSTAQTVALIDEVRVDASSDGKPAAILVLDDLAD